MTDKEKLIKIKSLADKMYDAAFNLTTDASLLRKAMDDYHQFIINEYHKEEPVSEDLEEAAKERVDAEDYCCVDEDGMPLYDSDYLEYMFKEGAMWQKEQIEEVLLSEVLPCFMHGGEADEVVAKLDEVLNQKKWNYG